MPPPFARAIARSRKAAVDNNRVTMSDQDESIEQFGRPADMNMNEDGVLQRTNIVSCSVHRSETWNPFGRDVTQTSFLSSSKTVSPRYIHQPLNRTRHRHRRFTTQTRSITHKAGAPAAIDDIASHPAQQVSRPCQPRTITSSAPLF